MSDYDRELGKYLNFYDDISDYDIMEMAEKMFEDRKHAINFKWIYDEILDKQRGINKQRNSQVLFLIKALECDNHIEGEREMIDILKEINVLRRKLKYLWHFELAVRENLTQQYLEAM